MKKTPSDRQAPQGPPKRIRAKALEGFHLVFTFHDAIWAVENQLLIDGAGRMLLRAEEDVQDGRLGRLRLVTLKESVRWLRINRLYATRWSEGEAYGDWLQMLEDALR